MLQVQEQMYTSPAKNRLGCFLLSIVLSDIFRTGQQIRHIYASWFSFDENCNQLRLITSESGTPPAVTNSSLNWPYKWWWDNSLWVWTDKKYSYLNDCAHYVFNWYIKISHTLATTSNIHCFNLRATVFRLLFGMDAQCISPSKLCARKF